jgi:hypothetical protein
MLQCLPQAYFAIRVVLRVEKRQAFVKTFLCSFDIGHGLSGEVRGFNYGSNNISISLAKFVGRGQTLPD